MAEPMQTWTETWPLAADRFGIWLLSGQDALRPALPVMADDTVQGQVDLTLAVAGAGGDVVMTHGTSWRQDGPRMVLTHVAVVDVPGMVLDRWDRARPVSLDLAREVGPPATHPAVRAPEEIRHVDVLLHAVRHLAFLADTDATAQAALPVAWLPVLALWRPALAGMFAEVHERRAG